DPVWSDFDGRGTQIAPKLSDTQTEKVWDPFYGVEPAGRLMFSEASRPAGDLTPGRLDARRQLLGQYDRLRPALDQLAQCRAFSGNQERAFGLVSSSKVRTALDVQREPMALRERYGMTLFGQAALAARRLVETGVKFVSVFWDPFGPHGGSVWDTHANHF